MLTELMQFGRRVVPARADLAAAHLRGVVAAERFVAGQARTVTAPLLDLRLDRRPGAERATQLLHGESFTVYEVGDDGLAWGQAGLDGYVGYVAASGLGPPRGPGRRVTALGSHVYAVPAARGQVVEELPYLAELAVSGTTGEFARLRAGGYVPRAHLAPASGDHVAEAERFVGVPYLWGGRSARGIDCSGLAQLALVATGRSAPRDTDMQAALVGEKLPPRERLMRGDLVFWRGHVGIMRDGETLLHANAHHMAVTSEPLAHVEARVATVGGGAVLVRRRP